MKKTRCEVNASRYKTQVRQHIFALTKKIGAEYPTGVETSISNAFVSDTPY